MTISPKRDVFHAIADPTRREIIGLIAEKPLNLNSIAQNFDMTRSAVSQHVKILSECGLVLITQKGRERYCEAKIEKLNDVTDWVAQYRKVWETRFDAIDNLLLKINKKNPIKRKKK